MNYTIKVYKNSKVVQKLTTHKIRRFLKSLRLVKFEDEALSVYLKVGYGKFVDVYGRKSLFYNDGTYDNKEDLWWAFNAFTEK